MGLSRIFALALIGFAVFQASPCLAQTPATPDKDALMSLARQFVKNVEKDLKKVDDLMSGLDPEDLRLQEYFKGIPDGEPLILQINLHKTNRNNAPKIRIEQPVMAIKQDNDVMISLSDFIMAADFPIFVDGNKGTADGWFIRENNPFHLDMNTRKLITQQETINVPESDALVQDGDILVRGAVLSRWFDFNLKTNTQAQMLKIVSAQPWPVQEKADRKKRLASKVKKQVAELPFKEEASGNLATPNVDVRIRQSYRKSPERDAIKTTRFDVQTAGDFLGYSTKATMLGTDQDHLTSLALGFSKSSENPDLLGPLKANFYEFNDISTVNVPLAGPAPQERGLRVTNKNPYISYDASTEISGDGPPGWDVELYRGLQYVDGGVVGGDGHYSFPAVTMFSGGNEFKIVMYGPQGEIREETRTYSVAPALLGADKGLYNVSLSLQNSQTYLSSPSIDPDKDALHLAGTYERQLNDTLTLQSGLQARQENGDQTFYVHGGAVKVIDKTILNANGVITSMGPYTGALTARRLFGPHAIAGSLRYKSTDYKPEPPASTTPIASPASQTLSLSAMGPLTDPRVHQAGYDANFTAESDSTGKTQTTTNLGLNTRLGRLVANNNLHYETVTSDDFSSRRLTGSFSLRGRALNTSWRATNQYDVSPELALKKYSLNLRRSLTQDIDGEMEIEHDIIPNYTYWETKLDWDTKYATISPSLSYDSNKVKGVKIVTNFGLSRNPYDGDILMRSNHLTDKGGVSAFVYLDKNGDGVFNNEDEPLPDVFVESVQSQRHADTNKHGEAFLYDLPPSRITDISIQESSSFDANWIPGFKGVSIRPLPGHVTRVEFPIHIGGEIDGTVRLQDKGMNLRPARQAFISLLTPEGERIKAAETAYDGFYYLGGIPPGVYYLTYEKNDMQRTDYDVDSPLKIEISPDGTTLYGTDLVIREQTTVPYRFASDRKEPDPLRPAAVTRFAQVTGEDIYLSLGQFNSRLSVTLAWYRFKFKEPEYASMMGLQTPLQDIAADPESGLFNLKVRMIKPATLTEASALCRELADKKFNCGVEIFTHYEGLTTLAQGS